jgi:hypothetical protein
LKKELAIFLLSISLIVSIVSLFLIKIKNKKIYILIIILLSIIITFVIKEKQNLLQEKNRLEMIKSEQERVIRLELEKKNIFNLEESTNDIYSSIKNGDDKNIILDKAYALISKAKKREDVLNSKSYLDLGKAYEIGALVGVSGASDLAFTNYNKYCELEPKDSNCYITLAKFLLLDKSKKKEALRIIKLALPFSKNEEETKNIKDIINYISALK